MRCHATRCNAIPCHPILPIPTLPIATVPLHPAHPVPSHGRQSVASAVERAQEGKKRRSLPMGHAAAAGFNPLAGTRRPVSFPGLSSLGRVHKNDSMMEPKVQPGRRLENSPAPRKAIVLLAQVLRQALSAEDVPRYTNKYLGGSHVPAAVGVQRRGPIASTMPIYVNVSICQATSQSTSATDVCPPGLHGQISSFHAVGGRV